MKVFVASSRPVGEWCRAWAAQNPAPGVELVERAEECEVFISVMYDTLIPRAFIERRVACFNFHPGLLPEYRGSGAFSWVIINDERETGITLHYIDQDIDHGPILDRRTFPIHDYETAEQLFARGERLIRKMFTEWYGRLTSEPRALAAEPQDESRAHIYYRRDLEAAKDLTRYKRAFTFAGKESAYYRANGERHYL